MRSLDVRIAIQDNVGPSEVLHNILTRGGGGVLGVVELENNGFGSLLPEMDTFMTNETDGEAVERFIANTEGR